jgi:hypothetical protein
LTLSRFWLKINLKASSARVSRQFLARTKNKKPKQRSKKMAAKKCLICNSPFSGRRDAKTCSPRCRKRLQKVRLSFYAGPVFRERALEKSLSHQSTVVYKDSPRKDERVRGWKKGMLPIIGILFGLGFLLNLLLASPATAATSSNYLNFQSRLLTNTGSVVADGNYNIEFKIDNDVSSSDGGTGACSGSCLWRETRQNSNAQGVRVVNGYLSVNLGSVTSFPAINWDQQLYLTMNIAGTGTGASPTYDGAMSPRITLTALPYAFTAGQLAQTSGANRGTLSFAGVTTNPNLLLPDVASGTVLVSTTGVQLQGSTPGTQQTGSFNISGTGIVGTTLLTPSITTSTASALGIANATATAVNIGNTTSNITTTVTGLAVFKPSTGNDSATAFQIQNAGAADTLFTADTTNNKIVIGNATGTNTNTTLLVLDSATADPATGYNGAQYYNSSTFKMRCYLNGAWADCDSSGSGATSVGTYSSSNHYNDGAVISSNLLTLGSADATHPGLIDTSNQTFAGNKTFTGTVLVQPGSSSTTAFQVQNSGGAQLLNVDTTNPVSDLTTNSTANLVTNGSMEGANGVTGWTARGSAATPTQVSTQKYIGNNALSETTTAAANDGAKYALTTTTLATNTQYTLTLSAKLAGSTTTPNNSMSTIQIGRAEDGSTDTSCLTAQTINYSRLDNTNLYLYHRYNLQYSIHLHQTNRCHSTHILR